jgi:uncharacterized protein
MRLNLDVELIDGLAVAYIKSINSIVLSDLHLGYESHMAKSGAFIPKVNLKKILSDLENALDKTKAKSIIVVGDIKNDFSNVEQDEFNELYEIIKFCKEKSVELILIKGNHDNFIDRYKESFKLKIYAHQAQLGEYFFFHGDKMPDLQDKKLKMLISGHEHPSIGIVNGVGRKERLRCFLFGKYKNTDLLVLPAISYFASGSDINLQPESSLLSPVLKKIDLGKARAIAIGYGSTLDFGTIKELRKLNQR